MADWNGKVQEAVDRTEAEVRQLLHGLKDEVVPDVRNQRSSALKIAAERLQELAKSLDDRQ